jgi:hypothetical protein
MNSTIRFTIAAIAVLSAAAIMSAVPRSKSPANVRSAAHVAQVSMVCSECQPADGGPGAMVQCKIGSKVTCAMCRTELKAASHGKPGNRPAGREVVLVNEKGRKCVFYAVNTAKP